MTQQPKKSPKQPTGQLPKVPAGPAPGATSARQSFPKVPQADLPYYEKLATLLDDSPETVWSLLEALPYSKVPDANDGIVLLNWLKDNFSRVSIIRQTISELSHPALLDIIDQMQKVSAQAYDQPGGGSRA